MSIICYLSGHVGSSGAHSGNESYIPDDYMAERFVEMAHEAAFVHHQFMSQRSGGNAYGHYASPHGRSPGEAEEIGTYDLFP